MSAKYIWLLFSQVLFTLNVTAQDDFQLGLNYIPYNGLSPANTEFIYQTTNDSFPYKLKPIFIVGINNINKSMDDINARYDIKAFYVKFGLENNLSRIIDTYGTKRRLYLQYSIGFSDNTQDNVINIEGNFFPSYTYQYRTANKAFLYQAFLGKEYRITKKILISFGLGAGITHLLKKTPAQLIYVGGSGMLFRPENFYTFRFNTNAKIGLHFKL